MLSLAWCPKIRGRWWSCRREDHLFEKCVVVGCEERGSDMEWKFGIIRGCKLVTLIIISRNNFFAITKERKLATDFRYINFFIYSLFRDGLTIYEVVSKNIWYVPSGWETWCSLDCRCWTLLTVDSKFCKCIYCKCFTTDSKCFYEKIREALELLNYWRTKIWGTEIYGLNFDRFVGSHNLTPEPVKISTLLIKKVLSFVMMKQYYFMYSSAQSIHVIQALQITGQ
jgi:hypothetical protein